MTYWVDPPGTVAERALAPRQCGSNDVTCFGNNLATTSVCQQLINSLSSGTIIGNSPRAVCLGQSNNQCSTSWSAAVGSMPEVNLFNAAEKIFNPCFSATFGSGLDGNVNLNGGCVTQWLSNRPNGC
ncbi:hypothetical protein DFH09DRAFT_1301883 [Mycena vulgaris]|nr:hypothetical protein DFH09DRAFT_1301883 [Mycena vulgaris]